MRRLMLFAVPFGIATAIAVYFLSVTAGLIAAGLCLLALLYFLLPRTRKLRAALLCGGLALGFLWSCGYELVFLRPIWNAAEQPYTGSAEICGYPLATERGVRVQATASVGGRNARLMLFLGQEGAVLKPGDRITGTWKLRPSTKGSDDSEQLYYQSIGIQLLGNIRGTFTLTAAQALPLRHLPAFCAQALRQSVAQSLPADTAGYLQALLTGDKSGLDYQTRSDMSAAGVSHTVAISGMHVSILLAMLAFFLGRRRKLTACIGIPLVLFFVFLTGASPSVVRAAVMQCIFLLAPLLNRENDPPTSLSAALLLLLLWNPWAVSNVSFQLSFGAMAGIFLFSGKLNRRLTGPVWMQRLLSNRWTRLPVRFLVTCIATSLGAMIFTVPIVAVVFGTVAVYGVLANLLILWAVSIIFTAGLLISLLGLLWLPGATALGWLLSLLIRYAMAATAFVAGLPGAVVFTASVYGVFWLVFAYLVAGLFLLWRGKKPLWMPLATVALGLVTVFFMSRLDAAPTEFSVTALDVGQGSCVCMLRGDFSLITDCGGSKAEQAGEAAARFLHENGHSSLDILVLTHFDEDHIGGVPTLLSKLDVQTLYLPARADDSGGRDEIVRLAQAHEVQVIYVTEDTYYPFDGGGLTIFAPVSDFDDNAACLSLLYTVGSFDTLITGDMDKYTELALLDTHTLPDIELYVAGHHGSKGSTGTWLLERLRPETVLISVGANSYGHPAQETLSRIAAVGAQVYRTDECGTITIGR